MQLRRSADTGDRARLRIRPRAREKAGAAVGRLGRMFTSSHPISASSRRSRMSPGRVCARRTLHQQRLRARLREGLPNPGRRSCADRFGNAISVRPSEVPARSTRTFKRASALLPLAARTIIGRIAFAERVRFSPAACARCRTRVQLITAAADSKSAPVPATANHLQPGESPPQPSSTSRWPS